MPKNQEVVLEAVSEEKQHINKKATRLLFFQRSKGEQVSQLVFTKRTCNIACTQIVFIYILSLHSWSGAFRAKLELLA